MAAVNESLKRFGSIANPFLRIWGPCKSGPIGVDIGDDVVKIAQLAANEKAVKLVAGGSRNRPDTIEPGSAEWQRWAITALGELVGTANYKGRKIAAVIPPWDVFIDHIRMPGLSETSADTSDGQTVQKGSQEKTQAAVLSKIKNKLPFEPDEAMVKYIPAEDDNVVVIAAQRKHIDRHLAIYEKTNLQISSIAVWPVALANCYVHFFGRRKSDIDTVVMLVDIDADRTNVVICRHKNLLFAQSICIGAQQLAIPDEKPGKKSKSEPVQDEIIARLVLELAGCRRHFASMYKKARIERLIFLSGQAVDKQVYAIIAKQLELPAQIGDCLAAVEIGSSANGAGIDRRGCQINWATAFGLSLS